MDHLKLPEGAKPFIVVAYDGKPNEYYEKVKGETFYAYPQSRGWTNDQIRCRPKQTGNLMGGTEKGVKEKTLQPCEIEKFFQTWLFFGLIIEVFAVVDIPVTTPDFLVPFTLKTVLESQVSHVVTTEKLPSLIVQWWEKERAQKKVTQEEQPKNFEKIMQLLDYVGTTVDFHCANGKDHRSIGQYGKVTWPVKDETTASIIAVAAMLRKAAQSIYDKKGKQGERWPVSNSRIIHQRILRKWCRSDAAMIMEDFDIDGQYYIAAAESHPGEKLDTHYACTDNSCEAKVADGTYVIQHAKGCNGDDYEPIPKFVGHVEPSYGKNPDSVRQAIMDIYDGHDLPFLRWDFEQRGLVTYGQNEDRFAEGADKVPPYVAISHVWANGMGNPFDNSLPYCQLEWIQKLVDDLCLNHVHNHTSDQKPGFWMDILCCLLDDRQQSEESEDSEVSEKSEKSEKTEKTESYKKLSIASMRKIYAEAVAVLIIDPWLMAIPSTADISELCARVYAAGWSRRLWTHQEGYLGKDVYYQFQDKPLSFEEIEKMAIVYQERLARQGYPISFPRDAAGKTSFYYTGIKNFIKGISDGHFNKDERWIVYQHLAKSLGYRATTKISDELLCIASIIGLVVKDYANIREKNNEQRTAELRMQAFLQEIGRFRQGIIFNSYRRLTIPGFRWAPASLLGHRSSGLGDLEGSPDAAIKDFSDRNVNDKYVEVSAGKFTTKVNITKQTKQIKNLALTKHVMEMVLENGKEVVLPTVGLPVDYPGYTIKFLPNEHGLTVNMAERRFGLKYFPARKVPTFVKPPPMPKVPSFGKVPTVGKGRLGGLGKPAQAAVEQAAPVSPESPVSPFAEDGLGAEIVSYEYVVYVAENDVQWEYDRNYTVILQKGLGDKSGSEFLAMVGLMSVGPGDRYWVQSLCSAVVRAWRPGDDPKVKAGIDMMDVSEAKTNWVVT